MELNSFVVGESDFRSGTAQYSAQPHRRNRAGQESPWKSVFSVYFLTVMLSEHLAYLSHCHYGVRAMDLPNPIFLVCPQCGRAAPPGTAPGKQCHEDDAVLVNREVIASVAESPLLGTLLTDNYAVYDLIGRGGMGTVYKAIHQRLDRVVAVKSIHLQISNPDEAEELKTRFSREARTLSRLRHPGIVTVYDYGEVAGGLYMILEFIEGQSLWSVLHEEGPLPVERAIPIVRQLLEALDSPHRAGLVHRDIKPSNVMLEREGDTDRVVLIDFGIAKTNETESDGIPQTRTGQVIGTVKYMPPEQLKGEDLGPWTDQYAVGCLLYRTLSGVPPFSGTRAEVAAAQLRDDPPLLPAALELGAFDSVIARAMAKDPAKRYPNNEVFVEEMLNAWVRHAGSAEVKITAPITITQSIPELASASIEGRVGEPVGTQSSTHTGFFGNQSTQSMAYGSTIVDDNREETSQTNLRGALSELTNPPERDSGSALVFLVAAITLALVGTVAAFLIFGGDETTTNSPAVRATSPSIPGTPGRPGQTPSILGSIDDAPSTKPPAADVEGRAANEPMAPPGNAQPSNQKVTAAVAETRRPARIKRRQARKVRRSRQGGTRASGKTNRKINQRAALSKADSAFKRHLKKCECKQAKASLRTMNTLSSDKKTVKKAQERYNLACELIGHGCNRAKRTKSP